MKRINFKFPKKKEQFKIDSIVISALVDNNTIRLKTRFATPLYAFMRNICICHLQFTNEKGIQQIVITDPEARFIPGDDYIILEILLPDTDKGCVVIEEE